MVFLDAARLLDQLPEAVHSAEAGWHARSAATPDATLAATIKNRPVVLGVITASSSTRPEAHVCSH
jgi:hypothetical protein